MMVTLILSLSDQCQSICTKVAYFQNICFGFNCVIVFDTWINLQNYHNIEKLSLTYCCQYPTQPFVTISRQAEGLPDLTMPNIGSDNPEDYI